MRVGKIAVDDGGGGAEACDPSLADGEEDVVALIGVLSLSIAQRIVTRVRSLPSADITWVEHARQGSKL